MASLSLSLFGPFRVALDGQPVTGFESDKVRALLAYLAVEAGRPHPRERLAGLLWPEMPERRARQNLSQALSDLRRTIRDHEAAPPFLLVSRQAIQFNAESDGWLDVAAFLALLEACQAHAHARLSACEECIEDLQRAVALYEGDFLEGFSLADSPAFEEWSLLERERLRRLAGETLERLVDGHEQRGETEQALHYARRGVALAPWRENAQRQLMRLLALSGQRGAALAQYEACCRILAEELGVEPEAETVALCERIRAGDMGKPGDEGAGRHNLPVSLTPFVGREGELAAIGARLQDPECRLLTLVGPGGIGKTRLAVESGRAQVGNYAHGVFYVSLGPLQSVEAIVPTIAQALELSFHGGAVPRQQMLDYLRPKSVLLILDNFEHLLDGVGLVTEMLKTAPDVRIVATSRARLNVRGEYLYPVGGMSVPDESPKAMPDAIGHSAVQLFVSSARRVLPGFALTDDSVPDVVHICRLVQGMPLAIELAAGLAQMLTPAEIGRELEAEMGRSLDVLATDLHDVPARQRSMRAVFDHSWRLLTEQERAVMAALSVFHGGFTRDAAQYVTGASLRELVALVAKSLLQRRETGRYDVHELLRQYAAEKLACDPELHKVAHERHCAYYAAALQRWGTDLKSPRRLVALAEMNVEIDNARAAWDWAAARGQVERLDRALEGLALFYMSLARWKEKEEANRAAAIKLEAMLFAEGSVLSVAEGPVLSRAEGLRVLSKLLVAQSTYPGSQYLDQYLRKALDLLESPELAGRDTRWERAFALGQMAQLAAARSDHEGARRLYEESLALYRALDDRWWMASLLNFFAGTVRDIGEARQLCEESLALWRAVSGRVESSLLRVESSVLLQLGGIALYQGQLEEGERLMREALVIEPEEVLPAYVAFVLGSLAWTLCFRGKYAEAHSVLEEWATICNDLGTHWPYHKGSWILGAVRMHLGRYDDARVQGQEAFALVREMGVRAQDIPGGRQGIGFALAVLGQVALVEGVHAEAQAYLQESVAACRKAQDRGFEGQALALLGVAARGLGDRRQAEEHLCAALRTVTADEPFFPLLYALPAAALLLADRGQAERAVERYALASCYPYVANSRWFEDVFGRHIAAAAASLPPDVVAAAQERGRARDPVATAAELLAELEEQR